MSDSSHRMVHLATLGLVGLISCSGLEAGVVGASKWTFASSAAGDCSFYDDDLLSAGDGAGRDHFGSAVAASGDTMVVGAEYESDADPRGPSAGAAYVFVRDAGAWTQQQRLTASDAQWGDLFGGAVAISGDTILVGAMGEDIGPGVDAGTAYVYVRTGETWTERAKLLPSDPATHGQFGCAVAVSGDTVVVASRYPIGAAYVFVRRGDAWIQQQKVAPAAEIPATVFSFALALDGDTLILGHREGVGTTGSSSGAAWVFVRNGTTWSEQQALTASDGAPGDWYGISVAVSGDTALIGAPGHDRAGILGAGAAYAYVRTGSTWVEQQELTASDGARGDAFGWSVSVLGDTALAGAPRDDDAGGLDAGAAYVFRRSAGTWMEHGELTTSGWVAGEGLGSSTATLEDGFVVGAPGRQVQGSTDPGAVHVFSCSGSQSQACDVTAGTPSCGRVTLDAGAPGPDDDIVAIRWSSPDCPDAVMTPDATNPSGATVEFGSGCGVCLFEARVEDAMGATRTGSVSVPFADATGPRIAWRGDAVCLWPPDDRYTCLLASSAGVVVSDDCPGATTWRFVGCASDEVSDGPGGDPLADDCAISPDGLQFCARAARNESDPAGRIYTVRIEALDSCGNASLADIRVARVPQNLVVGGRRCRDAVRTRVEKHAVLPWAPRP